MVDKIILRKKLIFYLEQKAIELRGQSLQKQTKRTQLPAGTTETTRKKIYMWEQENPMNTFSNIHVA